MGVDLTAKEFELLLCEFCKQDLPMHFKVEHDEKEVGGESEARRQIDVKITGRIGISDFLICGEAKNWNTLVDITTIDGLVGKYFSGEVRANKVILFSKNGYTEAAITRAKALKIELLQPDELGKPIKAVPYVVGMCQLGMMIVKIIYDGREQNLMAIDPNEYVILKGGQNISFSQLVARSVVNQLRLMFGKTINTDLAKINVKEYNILYELKQKPGYRYNGNFEVEVNLQWNYFLENLDAGVLRHLNTNEVRIVDFQKDPSKAISNVLLSPTKSDFEQKEDCINHLAKKFPSVMIMVFSDPDQLKQDPHRPLLLQL
jgi:hypothetical protein